MMILRNLGIGAVMLGLAACETATPAASTDTAMGGTIEAVVAAAQADVGQDIGGGVTLLSAEAAGDAIRFNFQFVATVAQVEALGRQEFEDGFTNGFVTSLCANPAVPVFLASGGGIEVTMVDPAGASIISRRVNSCG